MENISKDPAVFMQSWPKYWEDPPYSSVWQSGKTSLEALNVTTQEVIKNS